VILQEDGVEVGLDVVDGDEGFLPGEGKGFGGGGADEEAADEAGAVGDGDGVEFAGGGLNACGIKSLIDDGVEAFEVGAGGDFGDDAAEFGVEVDLGRDDVGEDFAAVTDDGGGGFIAGGLYSENEHDDLTTKRRSTRRRTKNICHRGTEGRRTHRGDEFNFY